MPGGNKENRGEAKAEQETKQAGPEQGNNVLNACGLETKQTKTNKHEQKRNTTATNAQNTKT